MNGNVTQDTLALMKQALAKSGDLAKSITLSTGLTAIDLQAPSKNLYPTVTPLRNSIARVGGGTGTATSWRAVNAITGSGYDAMGWVPEGQRSARMSYTTSTKSATFVTLGEEDQLSFEAEAAAQGFEDLDATMTLRLLQKMMRKEECGILGGNASLTLGTPATPTLSASGSGATLPAATDSVIVVALTFEGWKNSSLAGGVATSTQFTGADGNQYTLHAGSSNKSANATQAVTLGQTLYASVTPLAGAVAYAWYVGTAGSETLQAITTINSAAFSAPLASGRQAATVITADCSANASLAFDGVLTAAFNPANNAYIQTLATGTAGTGSTLTASGRGSIEEIDTLLQSMWDNYRLSPTVLYVNSQELRNITAKVLSSSSSPLLRYEAQADGPDPYAIVAAGAVEFYFNPFALDGGVKIPVKVHPDLPPGTLIGWCEHLPPAYQSNEVPNVAEIKTRRDYYRVDWPLRTRQREVGVYAEEVLAIYAPFALGAITNIGNG
ncbi:MAG TPA: hypothetical protein VH020_07385 [Stellaceae bacterium]|nr:hypothetical protein [Stellaceae bacterium]